MGRDDWESEGTAENFGRGICRQYKRCIVANLSKEWHRGKRDAGASSTTCESVPADRCVQAIAALCNVDYRRIASGISFKFRPRRILCSTGRSVDRVRKFLILRVMIDWRNVVKWIMYEDANQISTKIVYNIFLKTYLKIESVLKFLYRNFIAVRI